MIEAVEVFFLGGNNPENKYSSHFALDPIAADVAIAFKI